jgi:IclR family acetate operon transcriptional repressor
MTENLTRGAARPGNKATRTADGRLDSGSISPAADLAVRALFVLAQSNEPMALSDLARELDTRKSSIHRLLATLKRSNLVEQEPATRRYRLGYGVALLSAGFYRNMTLRTYALPHLEYLCEKLGETASLAVRVDQARVQLEQVLPRREVRYSIAIGQPLPLLIAASGKVLVSDLPDEEIQNLIKVCGLPKLTPRSITSQREFMRAIRETRERGFAISDSERFDDVTSAAAPIRDGEGRVVGALNVTGPAPRFDVAAAMAAGPLVAAEAAKVTAAISGAPAGARPWDPSEARR